jgi:hypothetical protein
MRDLSLFRDRRVVAAVGVVAGFLAGMVIFGWPFHLPPAWGDIPTWLLALFAGVAGWAALAQLGILQQQIADEVKRNVKRDELLDKQLEEAERRAKSERRRLVEDVAVNFDGHTGKVVNKSKRPINDLTSTVMSNVDRHSLATPAQSGELTWDGHAWRFLPEAKPVSRFETLRPGATCGFTFDAVADSPDEVLVAWFTDDDGFRWQLDEYQHLVQSDDESEYVAARSAPASPIAGA